MDSDSFSQAVIKKQPAYRLQFQANSRFLCLTALPPPMIKTIREYDRYSFWSVKLGEKSFTLCGVHLPSGLHMTIADRNHLTQRLRRDIDKMEQQVQHDRTVIVGDFNLNPYDESLVSSEGLHAVSCQSVALIGSRVVQGEESKFFYNPMWSFFGDRSSGPPGTFFWQNSSPTGYGWQMIDQVLLRPSILQAYRDFNVDILTKVGDNPLTGRNGRPDRSMSDHFPILFELMS